MIGRAFTTTLSATLGTAPYAWSATGLPDGFTLTPAGVLAGSTIVAGSYPVLLHLSDAGGQTASVVTTFVVQQTTMMAWGYNYSGQLGDSTRTDHYTPVPVTRLNGVTSVAGNGGQVLAVRADGSLWAWGANDTGALGLPSVLQTSVPTPVTGLSSVVAVAAAQTSSYALTADGTVWATGFNTLGQLGDGTTTLSRSFSPVVGLGKAQAIAAAVNTGYALLRDGTVWSWGDNGVGELGDGVIGGVSTHPVQVVGITGATALAGTGQGAYVLLADGTVRSWGGGSYGSLGNGASHEQRRASLASGTEQRPHARHQHGRRQLRDQERWHRLGLGIQHPGHHWRRHHHRPPRADSGAPRDRRRLHRLLRGGLRRHAGRVGARLGREQQRRPRPRRPGQPALAHYRAGAQRRGLHRGLRSDADSPWSPPAESAGDVEPDGLAVRVVADAPAGRELRHDRDAPAVERVGVLVEPLRMARVVVSHLDMQPARSWS